MSKIQLLRRLLAGRKLQHSLAVFVMACSVALAVCVLLLAEGLHSGITQAGKPFPLLMGAKGSPNQLVLNSVFLKDQPVGNISYTQLEKLRACYDYVRTFRYLGRNAAYGAEVRTIPYDAQLQFAKKIFTTGKGDCYNFTAAFCLLARQLGFSAECIVGECAYYWNWNGIAHGWVEVEIDGQTWLFDPQIENYNLRAGLSNEAFSAFQVKYETAHAYYMKH